MSKERSSGSREKSIIRPASRSRVICEFLWRRLTLCFIRKKNNSWFFNQQFVRFHNRPEGVHQFRVRVAEESVNMFLRQQRIKRSCSFLNKNQKQWLCETESPEVRARDIEFMINLWGSHQFRSQEITLHKDDELMHTGEVGEEYCFF
jgi:hypothetical protein